MSVYSAFTKKDGSIPTNAQVCEEMYQTLTALSASLNTSDRKKAYKMCGGKYNEVYSWLTQIHNAPEEKRQALIEETIIPILD